MKLKKMEKVQKVTLLLNIIAIVMGIFALFNIYTSHMYILSLVEKGFNPSTQVTEVINYYLTAVTPYVFYGICLAALSYIIKNNVCLVDAKSTTKIDSESLETVSVDLEKVSVESNEDDEIEMFFKGV